MTSGVLRGLHISWKGLAQSPSPGGRGLSVPGRGASPGMLRGTRAGGWFGRRGVYLLVLCMTCVLMYSWLTPCQETSKNRMIPSEPVKYTYDAEQKAYPYDRQMPLIFIGGVPRSGTTLMRAMLDAHPDIRCGEETRVIPRLLGMRSQWARSAREWKRLQEAGLNDEVIDSALAAFILEVVAKHGEPAPHLCNKDPFTLKSSVYLSQLFPNSKYVLMIRDGRAVVHSIISRKVTISGFDLKSFRSCLEKWNQAIESMYYQCLRLGGSRCMLVYYEQLVLHPQQWTHRILEFLQIPWDDAVLHHNEYINKPGGVSLSKVERSTDQVIKPVNVEALSKWVSAVPEDVKQDIKTIAPMLERLGYDPHGYPPNYGEADKFVSDNTQHIRHNEDYWRKRSQDLVNMEKPTKKVPNNNPHASDAKKSSGKQQNPPPHEVYGKDFDDGKQPGDKDIVPKVADSR